MENIWNIGDKFISYEKDDKVYIGTVKHISISQVLDLRRDLCYEVINLESEDGQLISIGQTKRQVYRISAHIDRIADDTPIESLFSKIKTRFE